MNPKLRQTFKHPGSAYRGKPFWAWNGALEPDELRRQIRLMKRMGLGGFFMHSRVGLDTPYLSDEWFRCVDACIDEARTQDMEAWLYDEDRWPSGAAGGLVTRDPRYRMRSLVMEELAPGARVPRGKDVVAVFQAERSGEAVVAHYRRLRGRRAGGAGDADATHLVFRVVLQGPSDWYNGQTYLDTLSHEAVQAFLERTHEAYRERVGAHFGDRVPGIFTDEPNFGSVLGGRGLPARVPWTGKLPEVFRKRYGYDLLDRLPELFFDLDGQVVSRARVHFHDCLTFLFTDAFGRQIGEWCERNGIDYTGHLLCEDSLSSQVSCVGACQRFYEHMQAPGMDLLTERWRVFATAKQVSSVARQFGRKWRLTETYGCTGWDFPLRGHKALGDWQVALGINLRCQHLSWYTMLGEAKRDYPAGIFYQSPWWEHYTKVEDYFARVLAVMTRGAEVRDLLVIHPVESMWTLCRVGWRKRPEVAALDESFDRLTRDLLGAHVDFDYGDEDLLARHGRTGRRDGAPVLRLAKASYRAIVVPPTLTLRSSTLALLRRFRKAGGTVVFAGAPPDHVDARPSGEAAALAAECVSAPTRGKALVNAVAPAARRLSIADAKGREIGPALYLLREDAAAYYLFVCNTGEDFSRAGADPMRQPPVEERTLAFGEVRITGLGDAAGRPQEWRPESGEIVAADARRRGKDWEIRTRLPALGSRLFVIPKRAEQKAPRRRRGASSAAVRTVTPRAHAFPYTRSEPNVLVLDRARYAVGTARWRDPEEILRVDFAVRDALGLPRRGGRMKQPWTRRDAPVEPGVPVRLRYRFGVDHRPAGEVALALETPERYRVALNGVPLSTDVTAGWWTDRSLRRLPFDPALLREGENELELTCAYRSDHPGFEIVYLLGGFGVRVDGTAVTIAELPDRLRPGDWTAQGLPFYGGSVTYELAAPAPPRRGERLFLEVPAYRGSAVRVLVEGRAAGVIAWEPNEVELTDLVRPGGGRVQVEVLGHRRNSHGPLHLADPKPTWVGPGQFVTTGAAWREDYHLVPCGLMRPPRFRYRAAR